MDGDTFFKSLYWDFFCARYLDNKKPRFGLQTIGASLLNDKANYNMTTLNSTTSNKRINAEKFALGTLTKSRSTPDIKGLRSSAIKRAERYALQNEAVKLLPNERVRFCLRHRIAQDKAVTVRYNENRKQAHYTNVQRCGSVWNCPVCAVQISEGRRSELADGISQFRKNKGFVYLLTLTNPHNHGDNLIQLLEGQKKALHYFWADRKPKEHLKALGKVGHIIATEVTHGKNGWHPHYHILLLFSAPVNISKFREFVASYWQHCSKKAGLKIPSLEHGADVQNGTYAESYISKWGIEDELTKGHIKKGRNDNCTPFDLLRLSEGGCEKSGALFQQFAKAFKGKRQLSWSRGLKELLLIKEATDEQLATETEADSIEVKELALEIWRLIKRFNARADYLKAVEHDCEYGSERADNLIMLLAERYVKENIHDLMKNADHWSVGAELLNIR